VNIRGAIEKTQHRLDDARARSPRVDAAYRVQSRSVGIGGNLFACAVAYRLFLWLLPCALVVAALAGFLRDADPSSPNELADQLGFSASLARAVASQAQASRWFALVVGLFALGWASAGAGRTMWTIHVLVWGNDRVGRERRPGPHRLAGAFLLLGVLTLLVTVAAAWARNRSTGIGWGATLLSGVAIAAVWFLASARLPHRDAPRVALLPGAILVAVGAQVLHLVSVYYLAGKLESASKLYGTLGTAATALLWLYLIGQLIVSSAVLNATLWQSRAIDGATPAPNADAVTPRSNHPGPGDSERYAGEQR
jgi:uncharacterized BrkB/YihY/UPF0761 family membrane protein